MEHVKNRSNRQVHDSERTNSSLRKTSNECYRLTCTNPLPSSTVKVPYESKGRTCQPSLPCACHGKLSTAAMQDVQGDFTSRNRLASDFYLYCWPKIFHILISLTAEKYRLGMVITSENCDERKYKITLNSSWDSPQCTWESQDHHCINPTNIGSQNVSVLFISAKFRTSLKLWI